MILFNIYHTQQLLAHHNHREQCQLPLKQQQSIANAVNVFLWLQLQKLLSIPLIEIKCRLEVNS